MKLKTIATLASAMVLVVSCGGKGGEQQVVAQAEAAVEKPAALESIDQKVSYIFGLNVGRQFKQDGIELDIDSLILALEDVKQEREFRLTDEQIQQTMTEFQAAQQAKQKAALDKITEDNKKQGEAFLAENGAKEGVVTTESGLQYREVTNGEGDNPKAEDTVTVHYKGTLIDGTVFDSSYDRGEPVSFPLSGVIPGWTEALQLMQVGDKWELAIPSELAYGPGGTGREIGPYATLIFEVELLKIN